MYAQKNRMPVTNPSESSPQSSESISGEFMDMQWAGHRPASFARLEPGDIVGRSRIIRELGVGGMGSVYLALHTTLQIEVAIKILPPVMVRETPQVAQRFIREAQLAARIHHPHVVSVMDADIDSATGLSYIMMEYMPGGSLAQKLREGSLDEEASTRIILEIAQALLVAAENNIVHRDIKPDNIMFNIRGDAKLADLGLAKQRHFPGANVTLDGSSLGTPAYMSPQQIRDSHNADAQDDIYSLGASYYECLTGSKPYTGSNPLDVAGKVQSLPVPDPRSRRPKISARVAGTCMKMMAKEKKDRYANAQDLVDDLSQLVPGLGVARGRFKLKPSAAKKSNAVPVTSYYEPQKKTGVWQIILATFILAVSAFAVTTYFSASGFFTNGEVSSSSSNSPAATTVAVPVSDGQDDSGLKLNSGSPAAPSPTFLPSDATPVTASAPPVTQPSPAAPAPAATTPAAPVAVTPPPATVTATPDTRLPNPTPETVSNNGTATGDALSAFQVKAIADEKVDVAIRDNLMQMSGPRRPDRLLPNAWRLLYWDPAASQKVRSITVADGKITDVDDGFVEWKKLRVMPYKQDEIIPSNKLQIDSSQALAIAQNAPELQRVKLSSIGFSLEKGKGNLPPFWRISLYGMSNAHQIDLGEVRVSAETGQIYEMRLKMDKVLRLNSDAASAQTH